MSEGSERLRLPGACLVVLVGAAGSGKSTWAAGCFRPEQVVSSDALRAAVGESAHDVRASADAFDLLERVVGARLRRGLVTVVDTLGTDSQRRQGWAAAARKARLPCHAVVFDPPAAELALRNRARRRPLPPKALAGQRRDVAAAAEALAAEGFHVHRPATVALVPATFLDAPADRARQREEPVTMRFGLQMPRFDGPATGHRQRLTAIARAAEEAGFDSLWVMDHLVQIPSIGREWEDMLESTTTLAWLAGVTSRIRLGALVTGITYRNPALLAKQLATLDVLSGGRAIAGLGAAWYEREHRLYGYDFPPLARRYALLEDALQLLPLLWGPGAPRFEGRTITVPEAVCYPRPLQERIPILVGGSGERRTLRLVARWADACNLWGDLDTVRRKVAVLHAHCADVGRDPAAVEVTTLSPILAAPGAEELAARVEALRPADVSPERHAARLNAATVEDHVGRFRAFADAGVATAIVSLPDLDADRISELAPLIAAFAA